MKLLKYIAGSLIISFGILIVLSIVLRAAGIELPNELSGNFFLMWIALGIVSLPFSKKIVRVE